MASAHDAVVVGSGPNGLAAAIELARAGWSVLVLEAKEQVGGGARSAELTLPGFVHDICSSVHPLGAASPFFNSLPLTDLGLRWVHGAAPLAHPLDDGTVATLERSVDETAKGLGRDARRWRRLLGPLVQDGRDLVAEVLAPRLRLPGHPLSLGRLGLRSTLPSLVLARGFGTEGARALIAGMAAHSGLPLSRVPTGGVAVFFGLLGHLVGWPVAMGGSQGIADALSAHLRSLGGEIETGHRVRSIAEIPPAKVVMFDVTPRHLARIAGDVLPSGFRRKLERFRYGPAVFKLDWALDGPIPWKGEACRRAATVHVGGTSEEIASGEAAVWRGEHPRRPFLILVQPTLFDPTRTPAGRHTAWAYCHVPIGSTVDMTRRIEAQVERFAPGFRDRILARSTMSPRDVERHNENYIGGDISGGTPTLPRMITGPAIGLDPYATPNASMYLCSSSTPPGPGVHGMCGFHAARSVLRRASS